MRRIWILLLAMVWICAWPATITAESAAGKDGLSRYLPQPAEWKGWKLDGPPQVVHGDKLFMLINGGAEIFLKHGFKSALAATYIREKNKSINLEIYEMTSPVGAKKIYDEKVGGEKGNLSLGEEARLEEYYILFRFKRFLVTLTGYPLNQETNKALIQLATLINGKLKH